MHLSVWAGRFTENFVEDKLRQQIVEKVELIETDGQKDRITPKKQKTGSVTAPIDKSKKLMNKQVSLT